MTPSTVDEYIAGFSPGTRAILRKVRATVRRAAPGAKEKLSYRMPAFALDRVLIYFAAFKNHIGIYPPVRRDSQLIKAAAPYAGEKGNLRLPLDKPIPYSLIGRIVRSRVKQSRQRILAKKGRRKGS